MSATFFSHWNILILANTKRRTHFRGSYTHSSNLHERQWERSGQRRRCIGRFHDNFVAFFFAKLPVGCPTPNVTHSSSVAVVSPRDFPFGLRFAVCTRNFRPFSRNEGRNEIIKEWIL